MKKNIKKIILLILILIFSHSIFYFIGSIENRKLMLKALAKEFKQINSLVILGRYIEHRDIASNIRLGKYDSAICATELEASSLYDDLKACLADIDCQEHIEKQVHNKAPEIFGETPLEFQYRDLKDGIRSCSQTTTG